MQYELARALQAGELSPDCYTVPHTQRELCAALERIGSGGTIRADTPHGSGFAFGRTERGQWAFATDEFLDGDERTPNPDFHVAWFDTVADGVRQFTINGKPLFDCVNGCRLWQDDCPCCWPDKNTMTVSGRSLPIAPPH